MAEKITLKPIEVGKEDTGASIDFSTLDDNQLAIAEKIVKEAESQGMDPELALSLAHIESGFKHAAKSNKGAIGVMQLMPGTAKELGVDPTDPDQNIKGGIAYYKQQLDKYKDPYVAGIAYNAGPGVADKFLETDDVSVIPTETLGYVEKLGSLYKPGELTVAEKEMPTVEAEAPAEAGGDMTTEKVLGAAAGAGLGRAAGKITDTAVKQAEREVARQKTAAAKTAEAVSKAESAVGAKQGEFKGRVENQNKIVSQAEIDLRNAQAAREAADKKLAKATEMARKYGVLEETVKTTPGGVTQKGGIGEGAMRHSNIMGEVHEANVVRKATEAAGPGWEQKSRLIVPDKYANAAIYSPEQVAARAEYDKATAEAERAAKNHAKFETKFAKETERLQNLTVKGPSGVTGAEAKLSQAKQNLEAAQKVKPSAITKAGQFLSKIPGSNVIPGAAAGLDVVETAERYKKGDIPGAAISGAGAIGGALSMLPPTTPLTAILKGLGTGVSIGAPALNIMLDKMRGKPTLADEAEGAVENVRQKTNFAGGGVVAAALKKAATKASEALGKHEGKTLMITQADRTKVGEGYLGGPGFSGLQQALPEYANPGAVWAVGQPATASMIVGANKRVPANKAIWIPMIGSPTQHKSNQMVFDKVYNEFKKEAKKGNLDPELRDLINQRIYSAVDNKGNPIFDASKPLDVLSPKFKKELDTFDKRAAVADILGGKGVGGKKGSIIDYDAIIRKTTDPDLLDAPTGSLGSRLFTLNNEIIERPDLHPAFPHILTGEDLGVHFAAAPKDIIMNDFITKFMAEKGRAPGYMDLTRGYAPSTLITEDMLTNLQKAGYAKGGSVKMAEGGRTSADIVREIYESQPEAIKRSGAEMYRDPGFFSFLDFADSPLAAIAEKSGEAVLGATGSPEAATAAYTLPYAATMVTPGTMARAGERVLRRVAPGALEKLKNLSAAPYAAMEATSPGMLQDTLRMRGTGELSKDVEGLALSDERAAEAIKQAGMGKYDVRKGQGAWGGGGESEFNRAYVAKMPRTAGPLSKYDKKLTQFGSDTDQMMMSNVRFFPQKDWAKSTAVEVKNVSDEDIVRLNKRLGDEYVVQHRPHTKSAVIFNWTDKPKQMGDLEEQIYSIVPKGRVTPGKYESAIVEDYAKEGVKPKSPVLGNIERKIRARK